MVFRRSVFESRKKTRSILRTKAKPPLRDTLQVRLHPPQHHTIGRIPMDLYPPPHATHFWSTADTVAPFSHREVHY